MALFWDLDNLPPDEEPSLVASQLLSIARALGSPARLTLLAAGNPTTFDYRPKWFEPPRLLQAAADGSVRCPLCGRREKSYEAARRHFKARKGVRRKRQKPRSRLMRPCGRRLRGKSCDATESVLLMRIFPLRESPSQVVHEKEREKRSRAGEAPDPAKEAKFLQARPRFSSDPPPRLLPPSFPNPAFPF